MIIHRNEENTHDIAIGRFTFIVSNSDGAIMIMAPLNMDQFPYVISWTDSNGDASTISRPNALPSDLWEDFERIYLALFDELTMADDIEEFYDKWMMKERN